MRAQVDTQLGGEAADGVGGLELADHVVEGGEVDAVAGPAGRDRQGDGEVGLADAGRAEQRRVGLALDERQAGQVPDLAGIELGLVGEVVVVDRLMVRHLGGAQRVVEPAFLADGELFLQDQVQEVEVAHLRGIGAFHVAGEGLGQVGQAELGGGGPDPAGDELAHASSFW